MKLIVLSLLCCSVFGDDAPLITIPDGMLKGLKFTSTTNFTYYAYRGVPYAKSPIGDLRFAAPVKNDAWNGTLDATDDRSICTQIVDLSVVGSEDCLYINVYTTSLTKTLPVMVWIHGGSFTGGGSSYYLNNPEYLLQKEVLFVAFNYRLGVFGFLSTADAAAPGNFGLKDQILALKWIQTNIQYFGGDPTRVTVFGESAGAASISYLLQTDLTAGLFRGAILESGTSLNLWALTRNPQEFAFTVGIACGIITANSTTLVRELRKIDYKKLKNIESNYTLFSSTYRNLLAGLPMGVVQEPNVPGAVWTKKSWEQFSTGQFQRVPLIVGFNSNEGNSLASVISSIWPFVLAYDFEVDRFAPYDISSDYLFDRLPSGKRVKSHYFGNNSIIPIALQVDHLNRFLNVDLFERPIRELVTLTSNYTNVYYYEFSYEGYLGNPNNTLKGVGHAEELNYLFKDLQGQPANATATDQLTIDRFTTLWTNFVKTGNPTPSAMSSLLNNLIWEPNNSTSNVTANTKYLNIGSNLTLATNPFQSDWEFYKGLYGQFGQPPYTTY